MGSTSLAYEDSPIPAEVMVARQREALAELRRGLAEAIELIDGGAALSVVRDHLDGLVYF